MATFCIPRALVSKLKQSAIKGEVNIKDLYKMSSAERREFFGKFLDKELSKFLNVKFEEAMVSKQQGALRDWAESVFKPKGEVKPEFQTVMKKIESLNELGVLNPESEQKFLQDLVADRLGVNVTPAEVAEIAKRAEVVQAKQAAAGPNLGDPNHLEENLSFFRAKKELDDYLASLAPASKLKVLTGTIGRGMMLASVKSPVLNIGSNSVVGVLEGLGRRLSSKTLQGADNELAMKYAKMVNKVYQATGYDLSRMVNLRDTGASGERILGDTVHSQGSGAIRKIGRVVEDIVFKQMMGAPDVAFSSAHFADSVNLNVKSMVPKGDKKAATALMEDAMRIQPLTEAGEILRAQGIMDAETATYTNKTAVSRLSEGIRKLLNDLTGDARLGDFVMPFVKTPANVVATGLDYAGLGFAKGLGKLVYHISKGTLTDPGVIKGISRDVIKGGLGLTAAVLISNQLSDDDFVGAYDPQRKQIEQLRNSRENSIKIGDKWVNTAWLGPISVPLNAIMYSRKYGEGKADKAFQYGKGMLLTLRDVPGLDLAGTIDGLLDPQAKSTSLKQAATSAGQDAVDEAYSRLIPSLFSDVAKAVDPMEREASTPMEQIQSRIPGARSSLPVKANIFGEDIEGEGAVSSILFGSRVRTDKTTPLIKELSDVQRDNAKSLAFTDWKKTNSKQVAQFRASIGEEEFKKAVKQYGQTLKSLLEEKFAESEYQELEAEDKLSRINALDTKAMKEVFDSYGFTYEKETKE